MTVRFFLKKTIEYLHKNTTWEIYVICDRDEKLAAELPPYVHYLPVPMKRGISLSGIKAMLEMYRLFRREKFDLIQYSTPNASLYASLAGKLAHIPVRLYCQWGIAYVGFRGLKRSIFREEEKLVCSLSTWIEPDSYSNLKFSIEEGLYQREKASVIWNGSSCGIDLERFDVEKKEQYADRIKGMVSVPADAYVFGFVGRITRDKGVNELLTAFQTICKERADVYLLLVGPSEVDDRVERSLYEWSLGTNRVIYAGYTDQVEHYLAAMDCFVLPSYREGISMSVVEAEAMGLPIIVTDIPGLADAMKEGETGFAVPPKDAEALYHAMEKMCSDREKGAALGRKAAAFAQSKFDQRRFVEFVLQDRKRLLGIMRSANV